MKTAKEILEFLTLWEFENIRVKDDEISANRKGNFGVPGHDLGEHFYMILLTNGKLTLIFKYPEDEI